MAYERVLRTWSTPSGGVKQAEGTLAEMKILLDALPEELSVYLVDKHGGDLVQLSDIFMQLGQEIECIVAHPVTGERVRELIGLPCEQRHLDLFQALFRDTTATTKRKVIENTLHRVSIIMHPPRGLMIGAAVRVGRAMEGLLQTMVWDTFLQDLARSKQSLLLVGRPGVGCVPSTALAGCNY